MYSKIRSLYLVVFASIVALGCSSPDETDIHIMTFNIRYDNPEDGKHRWSNRLPIVEKYLNDQKPDVLGMQEVTHGQLNDLIPILKDYQYVGKGRDDGKTKGEYSPIFWNNERFDLLENSQFWLSETPDSIGVPGWDAALPRIVTWAKLRDKNSDQTVYFFNTHFDHRGIIARDKSIELMKEMILKIAPSDPVVVMGDFNIRKEHHKFGDSIYYHLVRTFKEEVKLLPSEDYAEEIINKGTSGNGFEKGWENRPPYSVDYIFANNHFNITQHKIDYVIENDVFISDHWPVNANISFID